MTSVRGVVNKLELVRLMKKLRKDRGLSQADMAIKLGVTQSWVSKLESCQNETMLSSLIAYFAALGYSVSLNLEPLDRSTHSSIKIKNHPNPYKNE